MNNNNNFQTAANLMLDLERISLDEYNSIENNIESANFLITALMELINSNPSIVESAKRQVFEKLQEKYMRDNGIPTSPQEQKEFEEKGIINKRLVKKTEKTNKQIQSIESLISIISSNK